MRYTLAGWPRHNAMATRCNSPAGGAGRAAHQGVKRALLKLLHSTLYNPHFYILHSEFTEVGPWAGLSQGRRLGNFSAGSLYSQALRAHLPPMLMHLIREN